MEQSKKVNYRFTCSMSAPYCTKYFKIVSLFIVLLCSIQASGQYNYSAKSNYFEDPFTEERQKHFDDVLIKRTRNRPPEYYTFPQDGFIVLLDSTVHKGKLSLYGRCYNDLYGVEFIFPSTYETTGKWKLERVRGEVFNMASLLAFGLDDQSVNETEDGFMWENMFPPVSQGSEPVLKDGKWGLPMAIDTAAYTAHVSKTFRNEQFSFKYVCESTKITKAYVMFKDGKRKEGYVKLNRINGVVTEIYTADDLRMNLNFKSIKPKELSAYGVMENTNNASIRQNETPSSFVWQTVIPGQTSGYRKSKKAPGYVNLPDGTKLEGEIQLAITENILDVITIEQGKKQSKHPASTVTSFGILNAPKDESVDESTAPFSWSTTNPSISLKAEQPGSEWAESTGFVKLKDGNKITGKLSLKREYGFITEITIRPPEGKKQEFTPEQIASFANDKKPASDQKAQPRILADNEPRPAPDNPLNSKFANVPLAVNKSINESGENYFEWQIAGGSMVKQTEKSVAKPGYVILNNGDRVSGELRVWRVITKETRYLITQFKIKNAKDEFEYTQEDVKAYGVDLGTVKALQPGDKVQGMVIAKNPRLVRIASNETEPKAGFVQLMGTGEVFIGEVSERETMSGRKDITIRDIKGVETKYKGNLLAYGYFENKPFNEFPATAYVNSNEGYLRLIDNSEIIGRFPSGVPGVKTDDEDGFVKGSASNDPCAAPPVPPKTPPLNAFFANIKEEKMKYAVNADLLDEIFEFKIKTPDGNFKIQSDMVKSFGLYNILISDLTKHGMIVFKDPKLNFYKGSITSLDGKLLNGILAHIKDPEESAKYYGVYYAPDDRSAVKVYRMDQLKDVKQEIVKMEEYDPTASEFLSSKETSSTFDTYPNGTLIDAKGQSKQGKITLEIPPKLWFATSVIFTDPNGVQEIYDKDNELKSLILTNEGKTKKYIPYQGVFVEVLQELEPFYYFRNPFPSIETNSSTFLNKMIAKAVDAGMKGLAKKIGEETGDFETAVRIYESGMGVSLNIALYEKEYMVYDAIKDRGFLYLNKDLGDYTAWPELEDLKNGCSKYIFLGKDQRKALGDIEDIETGNGIMPTLKFLKESYYSGL